MTTQKNLSPKIESLPNYMQKKAARTGMFAVVLAAILTVLWLYGFQGPDWEVLTTKHYWKGDAEWFYGGWASQFEETSQGYRTIQKESLTNYYNLYPFSENNSPLQAQYHVGGWPSTERLAIPFLVYLIIGLTGGYLDVWSAFYVLNIILWLFSILLAHQLASIYFEDQYSPFFAALFVTFFPVFTLNFHGLKISYISTVLLLAGMYVFEKKVRHVQAHLQFVYFLALFFFGLFAAGGWLFLFVYLFIRHLSLPRPQRWGGVASMVLALLIAQIALGYLRQSYHLPLAEEQRSFSYGTMLSESMKWLWAWMHGQDVGAMKFLNFGGFTLFTGYLPLILRSFAFGYWMFLLLSIPAWIFVQRARIFILASIPLFFTGHGGYMIIGWVWHYGYLSAPAAMMLILAVAGFLGWMVSHPQPRLKVLAIVLLLVALFGFMDQKLHAILYYGGIMDQYHTRVILHYGESNDVTEY